MEEILELRFNNLVEYVAARRCLVTRTTNYLGMDRLLPPKCIQDDDGLLQTLLMNLIRSGESYSGIDIEFIDHPHNLEAFLRYPFSSPFAWVNAEPL